MLPPQARTGGLRLDVTNNGKNSDQELKVFFEKVYDKLGSSPDSVVDVTVVGPLMQESFLAARPSSYRQFIGDFVLSGGPIKSLTLDTFYISTLHIQATQRITIKNSRIGTVIISPGGASVDLQNTYIGKVQLFQESLKHLNMHGGGISELDIPPPQSQNPFTGPVWFSGAWFPIDKHSLDRAQPYRNMRYHLRDLENVRMADLFHALELRAERQQETWTNKIISYVYDMFSDFGASILRPILWLILLGISVSYILIAWDGAVPTRALELSAVGWQTALLDDDIFLQIYRGSYLSFYSIIHPLGLFGGQPLLVASTKCLSILLIFEGIFAATLVALTIFALRRRFKLQQT